MTPKGYEMPLTDVVRDRDANTSDFPALDMEPDEYGYESAYERAGHHVEYGATVH